MKIKSFTSQQYKRYCKTLGSNYIVSEFALFHILKLINIYSFRNILEIGVGIGTISDSILKYSQKKNFKIKCYGTENVAFCLNQIPVNLGENFKDLKLYADIGEIRKLNQFGFIIIDGSEEKLKNVDGLITNNGIILIEGDRKEQEMMVKDIFPKSKFVHLISLKRNGDYSVMNESDFRGGLKVIFVNPNIMQSFHWCYLKLKSSVKMQLRKKLYA